MRPQPFLYDTIIKMRPRPFFYGSIISLLMWAGIALFVLTLLFALILPVFGQDATVEPTSEPTAAVTQEATANATEEPVIATETQSEFITPTDEPPPVATETPPGFFTPTMDVATETPAEGFVTPTDLPTEVPAETSTPLPPPTDGDGGTDGDGTTDTIPDNTGYFVAILAVLAMFVLALVDKWNNYKLSQGALSLVPPEYTTPLLAALETAQRQLLETARNRAAATDSPFDDNLVTAGGEITGYEFYQDNAGRWFAKKKAPQAPTTPGTPAG